MEHPTYPSQEMHQDASANARRVFLRTLALTGAAGSAAAFVSTEAKAAGLEGAQTRQNFAAIQRHENDHVTVLLSVLGADARPKPTFKNLVQPKFKDFFRISQALENTGVGAYLGAAPFLESKELLAAASSIALIEARHAGWLNSLVNDGLSANVFGQEQSFDAAFTADQVVQLAGPFVESLNGGPPLAFSMTPSAANDIAILNYALALEYLEAEFYNLNVPSL